MVDANKYRMTALAKKGTATTNAQVAAAAAKAKAPSPVMGRGVVVDKAGPGNQRTSTPVPTRGSGRRAFPRPAKPTPGVGDRYKPVKGRLDIAATKGVAKGLPSNASPKAMEARLRAAQSGKKKGYTSTAKTNMSRKYK